MVSDSSFSYIHMESQMSNMFVETWENQKLRWDDVELPNGDVLEQHDNLLQQFFSQIEDVDNDLTLMNSNNPLFNASYANRLKQKSRKLNWTDVDLKSFSAKENRDQIHDMTILNKPNLGNGWDNLFGAVFVNGLNSDSDSTTTNIQHVNTNTNTNTNTNFNTNPNFNSNSNYYQQNSDDEFENDNQSIGRNVSNADISRNFSYQFTTPTVNNRVHLHNFPGSSQRPATQKRRSSGENNNSRNVSYHTPRHGNIR